MTKYGALSDPDNFSSRTVEAHAHVRRLWAVRLYDVTKDELSSSSSSSKDVLIERNIRRIPLAPPRVSTNCGRVRESPDTARLTQ
ncbi:hypothetical protein EVAR_5280_1 [Eumeta japonica]|uniref:Uncharacterized protein n=1 Tax=Eumeta variegata TaxID=151549 RepID=A0A4C1TNV9_EUMVA|nr:hypothetical protein EVAR_5280_1 [Eumeta japonica]